MQPTRNLDMKEYKIIPLKHGNVLVDTEDYDLVKKLSWYSADPREGLFYAMRNSTIAEKERYMHRLIMKAQKGQIIDHINGNGLDNRKKNLRFVTNKQNLQNRSKQRNSSRKYKGVAHRPDEQSYVVVITIDDKQQSKGVYKDPVQAAMVYDVWALFHHGEYARTNRQEGLLKYHEDMPIYKPRRNRISYRKVI